VRKGEYTVHKDKVWAEAYVNTQVGLMTWPQPQEGTDKVFQDLEKTGHFGDPINDAALLRYRDKLYQTQFPKEKEGLEVFLASPSGDAYLPLVIDRNLLGQITWGKQQPTVEECWLAQEDLWLRREVLRILQEALESMGKFKEVKELRWNAALAAVAGGPVDGLVKTSPALKHDAYKPRPLGPTPEKSKELETSGVKESRLFRNHNWEVNLLLEEVRLDKSKRQISARSTIKNINPSRRPLSLSSSASPGLRLQLRQQPEEPQKGKATDRTMPLTSIIGVLLSYGEQAEFKVSTVIGGKIDPSRDFDLEEVFDRTTSPIKRLEALQIGEPALPHRIKAGPWRMDINETLAPPPKPEEGAQAESGQSAGPPSGGGGAPGPGGGGGGSGGFAPGGMGGGDQGKSGKADKNKTPNYGIRRDRYVLSNQVVRRVPIAFTVIVDQDYRNEVLAAVANSTLRIQTAQVYWAHRGEDTAKVNDKTDVFGSSRPSGDFSGGGPPMGPGGGGSGGFQPPGGGGPGGGGLPPGAGSGSRPPGSGSDGPTRPSGDRPGEGSTRPGGTTEDTAPSLSEANRNLIGLTVHGIATLYERYPPKKKDEGTNQGGSESTK